MLLLTMAQPWSANKRTTGCISNSVFWATTPSGRLSRIHSFDVQYAMSPTIPRVVGMGVPSKYLLLPVTSLGTDATVTLKRARRERPHKTKKLRTMVSKKVRKPMLKAQAAGATPNEIKSASESSSCPINELFFLHRATLPSMKSKNKPKGMNIIANQSGEKSPGWPRQYLSDENTDMIPQKPLSSVIKSAT